MRGEASGVNSGIARVVERHALRDCYIVGHCRLNSRPGCGPEEGSRSTLEMGDFATLTLPRWLQPRQTAGGYPLVMDTSQGYGTCLTGT
jgi:hypothetical protein